MTYAIKLRIFRIFVIWGACVATLIPQVAFSKVGLTGDSALTMIQEKLESETYSIDVTKILNKLGYSTIDYSTNRNNPAYVKITNLIQAGYVDVTNGEVNYPDISGTWRADLNVDYGVIKSYKLELAVDPFTNEITGTGKTWSHGKRVGSPHPFKSPVAGSISLKGALRLEDKGIMTSVLFGGGGFADHRKATYQFVSGKDGDLLVDQDKSHKESPAAYRGSKRGTITRTRYHYTKASSFKVSGGSATAGTFAADGIHRLKLDSVTDASAEFDWHVNHNTVGEIIDEDDKPSGTGHARFAVKPDGTWFLLSLSL